MASLLRKLTLCGGIFQVTVAELKLSEAAEAKLLALATTRYTLGNDELKLVSARFPSSEMNKEYLKGLLGRLVTEARKE